MVPLLHLCLLCWSRTTSFRPHLQPPHWLHLTPHQWSQKLSPLLSHLLQVISVSPLLMNSQTLKIFWTLPLCCLRVCFYPIVNLLPSYRHLPLSSVSNLGPIETFPISNCRTYSMTTRSMNNIFKPKQVNVVTKHPLPQSLEPTFVTLALSMPQWCAAMYEKLTTLMRHGTWDLVSPPVGCNLVGCKWVFGVK